MLTHALNAKSHQHFTYEEETRGKKELSDIVPAGHPFICFHVWDSAYLNKTNPNKDWSYHDYKDASIHSYLMPVEKLVQRGY